MTAKTKELHFEDAIEHHLLTRAGWTKGDPKDFDRKTALVAKDVFAFIEATQPDTWKELRKQLAAGLEDAVLDRLVKELDARGTIDLLRHGFKFFGKKLECATFAPAHGMNPDVSRATPRTASSSRDKSASSKAAMPPSTSCCSSTAFPSRRRS